jgi:hypothetical protein
MHIGHAQKMNYKGTLNEFASCCTMMFVHVEALRKCMAFDYSAPL